MARNFEDDLADARKMRRRARYIPDSVTRRALQGEAGQLEKRAVRKLKRRRGVKAPSSSRPRTSSPVYRERE